MNVSDCAPLRYTLGRPSYARERTSEETPVGNLIDLLEGVTVPLWMADGTCRDVGEPDAWFPTAGAHKPENTFAARVCGRCPVRVECRAYALRHPQLIGIWGGTSFSDRNAIRANERAIRATEREPA